MWLKQCLQNKLLLWLVLVIFLKGAVTSLVVPLWEFPDEQAHFAQVAYYVETGTEFSGPDLSREIYQAQLVMGTVRDEWGINQHTYKAHFRPAYSDSLDGIYETDLSKISPEARTEYVKNEAARYQPLFYQLSSLAYRLSYDGDIITRVFAVRWVSILISILIALVAYRIGQKLFKRLDLALMFSLILSFQPMFSFVSAGTNNDNLLNLLSLVMLWLVLDVFERGLNWLNAVLIGIIAGLGILTKPLMIPVLLPVPFLLIWEWWLSRRSLKQQLKILLPSFGLSVITGGYLVLGPILLQGHLPFITNYKDYSPLQQMSFWEYIGPQISRYYRETLVWYWGIFKWLGVIMPLNIIRFIKVLMIFAGVGIIWHLFSRKSWLGSDKNGKQLVLILIIWSVAYIAAITLWDFDMVRKNGVSHGLQGRYFFPTIGAHMALLLIGLLSLIKTKWRQWLGLVVVLIFVGLQLVSLYVLSNAYYDLTSVRSFFLQLSQYKPDYFKYPFALWWLIAYFWSLVGLIYTLVKELLKPHHKLATPKR